MRLAITLSLDSIESSMLLLGPAVDDSLCGCIIPVKLPDKLCFMLFQTNYSGNYAGILDASLAVAHCIWFTLYRILV